MHYFVYNNTCYKVAKEVNKMRNNILKVCALLISSLSLSSCTFIIDIFDSSSSNSTSSSNDPNIYTSLSTTTTTYEENSLLIYENPNPLVLEKGGYHDINFDNASVNNLIYTYSDINDHSIYSNIDNAPSVGELNILVVPVQFGDTDINADEKTRLDIYNAYFGDEETTGFESVSSYFYKTSYGRLKISGVVTPWYQTNVTSRIGNETQVASLADRALDWYKQSFNDDATTFDSDSNGYIDCICLIYNVPSNYNGNDNLWAYTYWANNVSNIASPNVSTFFWASTSFMYESRYCDIDGHTYIHEMGHALGLDDYYNYDDYSYENVAGGYIMQSHNVGDHDPFSKMALGWVDPLVVYGSTTVTLESFTESGQCIVLKGNQDQNMNSPFDEYIVIDLYTPTNLNKFDSDHLLSAGYPQGPKTTGVRIWHVDSRLAKYHSRGSWSYELVSEIEDGYYYQTACSNSTDFMGYGTSISECINYRLLHLLEKDNRFDFKDGDYFDANDMWYAGESFTFEKYNQYFADYPTLNNGEMFNFEITVDTIINNTATITIEVN